LISSIVVVGGGHAGAQAVEALRKGGFPGRLVLVSGEPNLPYQRPPLSKAFLSGELAADRLLLRHRAFYDEHRIEIKLGSKVVEIEPGVRRVRLSNHERIEYDRLILCLGATARQLSCPGADLEGVHYLRSVSDVPAIQRGLKPGGRAVIIVGGYIGLETAATARRLGCNVTVLEMTDRLMNRVVASNVSEYFAQEHRSHGVNVVCNARVLRLEGEHRAERVICDDGSVYPADLVVVGIGAVANTELASHAGLACEHGIVVDEFCRTSDPAIYAAGDCTYHPSRRFDIRVRLESVDNAFEQAKTAASNVLDRPTPHDRVPWFWSDQYDNKLLIVGLSQGFDQQVTRGSPGARNFTVCYLKGGALLAVEAINNTKDYMAARSLIANRARPELAKLYDPSIPLKQVCE
jgi:3-phenylpropionate/trans-cinnamate dioxygenase ferredoxin reductase subunit